MHGGFVLSFLYDFLKIKTVYHRSCKFSDLLGNKKSLYEAFVDLKMIKNIDLPWLQQHEWYEVHQQQQLQLHLHLNHPHLSETNMNNCRKFCTNLHKLTSPIEMVSSLSCTSINNRKVQKLSIMHGMQSINNGCVNCCTFRIRGHHLHEIKTYFYKLRVWTRKKWFKLEEEYNEHKMVSQRITFSTRVDSGGRFCDITRIKISFELTDVRGN